VSPQSGLSPPCDCTKPPPPLVAPGTSQSGHASTPSLIMLTISTSGRTSSTFNAECYRKYTIFVEQEFLKQMVIANFQTHTIKSSITNTASCTKSKIDSDSIAMANHYILVHFVLENTSWHKTKIVMFTQNQVITLAWLHGEGG